MKLLIVSLFTLIFLPCQMHGQNYRPMAIENATWIMGGYGDYENSHFAYKIEGDTTINQVTYHKLYIYNLERIDSFSYAIVDRFYSGYMRDDIENRKVYGNLIQEPWNWCPETAFSFPEFR